MKYAWIENNKIRDIAPGNPSEFYHPDVAAFYDTEVPDNAANGDGWVNGQVVKPEVVAQEPSPRTWDVSDIREKLTLAEKVKWDNDKTDTIKTAKVELSYQRNETDTTAVLQMLVDAGDISADSMSAVLA